MAKPKTIARVIYDKVKKDWVVQTINARHFRYDTLPEALTFADTLFKEQGDAITVHHADRSIELLLAPIDLFQTLLRHR
jgi:tRNA1(Val) A37 N6-methylase TrmN6